MVHEDFEVGEGGELKRDLKHSMENKEKLNLGGGGASEKGFGRGGENTYTSKRMREGLKKGGGNLSKGLDWWKEEVKDYFRRCRGLEESSAIKGQRRKKEFENFI